MEKDKKQIKSAINKYGSDFGIVISNKSQLINKEENIINIPVSTFAFI